MKSLLWAFLLAPVLAHSQVTRVRSFAWVLEYPGKDGSRLTSKTKYEGFPVVIDMTNMKLKIYAQTTFNIDLVHLIDKTIDSTEYSEAYTAVDKQGLDCTVLFSNPKAEKTFALSNGDRINYLGILRVEYDKIAYMYFLKKDE